MAGASRPDRLSPESPGFEKKLADNGIYKRNTGQKPQNLHEIREHLARRRTSLSSSKFSEADFNDFVEDNRQADTESRVMSHVIPTIVGEDDRRHLSMEDVKFQNLEPFADDEVTAPTPKRYYGAAPEDIDRRVHQDLGSHILPSTGLQRPAVPNYFLEAKTRAGSLAVADLQACHDGAVGARAMHSLQNYKVGDPVYDQKARTITCIYHGGLLELYTHHLTEPTSPGGKSEYHMNQVASVSLTASPESFREGATAYRNARDWAKMQRDAAIAEANARARRTSLETVSSTTTDHNRTLSATAEAENMELDNSVEVSGRGSVMVKEAVDFCSACKVHVHRIPSCVAYSLDCHSHEHSALPPSTTKRLARFSCPRDYCTSLLLLVRSACEVNHLVEATSPKIQRIDNG